MQKFLKVNIKEETKWICGVKLILMMKLVYIHVIGAFVYLPSTENLRYYTNLIDVVYMDLVLNPFETVESFLFLSAFLTLYLRRNNVKHSIFYYIMFAVKRFIRLTFPVLCASAIALILPIFCDVPHSQFLQEQVNLIEENWWKFVFHISNFYKLEPMIITHMWIMNVTLQLNVITVPILFILDRWPKCGIITMLLLTLIGFAANTTILYITDTATIFGYCLDIKKMMNYYEKVYFKPHCSHLSSYCIGLLVGYLLSEKKISEFEKKTRLLFWMMSIACLLLTTFGIHGNMNTVSPNENSIMLYKIFAPYVWIVAQIWVCIAFTKGHGGIVKSFLSSDIFVRFDCLNVSLYVVHFFFIFYIITTIRKPFYLSMLTLWMAFIFVMFVSMIASFIFYLFLEAPFNAMFKNVFYKTNSNETSLHKNECQLQTINKLNQEC
ncbi:nose resistant to fluoxetine protein 6-like [Centruroides vittatus]|uniref:nose resistant to fluoxetine protein 6-like n=1 Tax=Centruroides vittatus TaxID=120091 RepID=UPI0035100ABF